MTWPPGSDITAKRALTRDHLVQAERIERADWRDAYEAAGPELASALGMRVLKVGAAEILQMTAVDMLMFNRVAGLGVEEPATEEELDQAIGLFQEARVPRFFLDVSPMARPLFLADWIAARGISLFNNWVKLTREVGAPPAAFTNTRVAEVGPDHARDFGSIVQTVFGLPERMADWAASLVGRKGRRQFMAFERDKPVGVAALYYEGEWAEFGYAAVLPEARGLGIQAALIAARIRAARESGCRWISMETAEETLEKPSYSLRNARKMGFEVAYLRPNYLGTTT
ncbi:MAG TPA: GNAT family N-acetyltransferase [Candidatus Polarisedimenticolia bacterium]|nr:GNAT family N-acetyltransferase [Candidatus Polarisedimenticolia bacterium]